MPSLGSLDSLHTCAAFFLPYSRPSQVNRHIALPSSQASRAISVRRLSVLRRPTLFIIKYRRRSKVLTIHGTEDETIPVADAYEFDKVLPNNELVVVEGATHRFATEPEQVEVMKALNRYLEKAEGPSTAER